MHISPETPISVAITLLRREIEDRKSALAILEALVAQGVSPTTPVSNGAAVVVSGKRYRRGKGGKRPSIVSAAITILRAAGKPMHGLREIIPALEQQGYKIKHRTGLATILMRSGEVERTSPGTFAVKGGATSAN